MRRRSHVHRCALAIKGCQNTVDCTGTLERNHDGFPETVCSVYHLPNGETDPQPCEDCYADTCVLCERVVTLEGHSDRCSQHPDNVEGPDPLWDVAMPFARNH